MYEIKFYSQKKKGCPISKAFTQKHDQAKQKFRFDFDLIFFPGKKKKKHRSKTF